MEENTTNKSEEISSDLLESNEKGNKAFNGSKVIVSIIVINLLLTIILFGKNSKLTYQVNLLHDQISNISTVVSQKPENIAESDIKDETANVSMDTNTNTNADANSVSAEPETNNEPEGYGRKNPAPINVSQSVNIANIFDKYTATVTVNEIIDGSAAWDQIFSANQFNNEPAVGKKYVLVKVKATVTNVENDEAVDISDSLFDCFSSDNSQYKMPYVVEPEPKFEGQVYNDGSIEGYVVFEVDETDPGPKIVFGNDSKGKGGIWFKISN